MSIPDPRSSQPNRSLIRRRRTHAAAWLALVALPLVVAAAVKVNVQHDEAFPFRTIRTWSWHPDGRGVFRMKVTAEDDPAPVKERFGPILEEAIATQLTERGLQQATSQPPDLYVTYYALISAGTQTQTMGQFVPAVPEWGLPPFAPATQSFRVIEQGSLVIDLVSPAEKATVWRAVSSAELHRERPDAERNKRLREAVREMLRKYPPRQK